MMISLLIFLFKTQAACLPGSISLPPMDKSSFRELESVVQNFEDRVERDLKGESLVVRFEAENPRVNAEAKKEFSGYSIAVFGGMMAHPKMNEETLYLLLCHELGHILGGPPLKSRNGWSSTESQSDFFSSGVCFKKFQNDERIFIDSALNLTSIYADVLNETPPELNSCDPHVVDRTNFGYPSLQCRLDTLLAGWRNQPRPRCWFFE